MEISAIIVSSGKGTRMGGPVAKQYMEIHGNPVLYYTIRAFEASVAERIVIVADDPAYVQKEIVEKYGFQKVCAVVKGGAERYLSVYNGLQKLKEMTVGRDGAGCDAAAQDIVLIHDGVRPMISAEAIERVVHAVEEGGAAIAGMPVKDTIKIADAEGNVASTTERSLTWQIQTPQGFWFDDILAAYETALGLRCGQLTQDVSKVKITDDAMLYEMAYPNRKIRLVEGGYENIKLTTPDDLIMAERLLK